METQAYLDTHIVVWLNDGEIHKLSENSKKIINNSGLLVSEYVRLELQYLFEIDRLAEHPDTIIGYLKSEINLQLCPLNCHLIITEALHLNWTRDPFDRLITANASFNNTPLITKDETILANYQYAVF